MLHNFIIATNCLTNTNIIMVQQSLKSVLTGLVVFILIATKLSFYFRFISLLCSDDFHYHYNVAAGITCPIVLIILMFCFGRLKIIVEIRGRVVAKGHCARGDLLR